MRRRKPLPQYKVNGWIIDKRPNSFAERYAWDAQAVNAEGYLIARYGFSTLSAARAFCEATIPPLKDHQHGPQAST
jgi:hypothetical protein